MNLPKIDRATVTDALKSKLSRYFGTTPEEATAQQMYQATVLSVRDLLSVRSRETVRKTREQGAKQVFYLCMEFLMGRMLRMNLCNLGVEQYYREALSASGWTLDDLYELEPDPGLGNGGLGRLAACFLDALTSQNYAARGFSILYEYGLFKQRIVDGEQLELPDIWLPEGHCWLVPRPDEKVLVRFGGTVREEWKGGHCDIVEEGYDEYEAVPYDLFVTGGGTDTVNTLRLWKSRDPDSFDMQAFSQGQYVKALEDSTMADAISKVLYPADNHHEGKLLRLSQQYFLVSATLQWIVSNHLSLYRSLETLPDYTAIHINDTHPALAIPELMRILMDLHHFSWEQAWDITTRTVSYTNHTVLPEALEVWNENLFSLKLPRIYAIIREINERFCRFAWQKFIGDWDKIGRMAVLDHGQVKMANLSVIGSHCVNGVSGLHSEILKTAVFRDYFDLYPDRFTNVTNGIAHRRWLCCANPGLSKLLDETIGDGYRKDPEQLAKLRAFADDGAVLDRLDDVKRENKRAFAKYLQDTRGVVIDPESIFDVQAKRMHEYKRQLLNALHIISLYQRLREDPTADVAPRTFLFGAKAAPGYYLAKDILRLICCLGAEIEKDPRIREKLRVVFLENYNVTLAEHLMPAAEISEQISLAGKEASGTGNMKFMINGALTIGTLDGANVEMARLVGADNIFIFGHTAEEVEELWRKGYASSEYYARSPQLKKAVDSLQAGYNGRSFEGLAKYLLYSYGVSDPFLCLADYDQYAETHERMLRVYADRRTWNRMSLENIASAGYFAADRCIREYADRIWRLRPLREDGE